MEYLVIAMIASFIGGIWIFFDAYDRFGWFIALLLVGSHLVIFLQTTFPLILVLYGIFWLIGFWLTGRKLPEDEAPKFGRHVTTTDPKAAAEKRLEDAEFADDTETIDLLRKYILRIERGEY